LTVFLAFCPMQAKNNRKIISISKLFTTMKNNLKIWWGHVRKSVSYAIFNTS
jgi:hypothetical protein